jgi:hypothetical protein
MINVPRKINPIIREEILSKYSAQKNKKKIKQPFDLFLCNAGYEIRSTGFLKNFLDLLCTKNAFIFVFHPKESNLYVKNLKNLKIIKSYLKDYSPNIIELDPTNPWNFREIIQKTFFKK